MTLDKVAALKRTRLFQALGDETLRSIAALVTVRSFRKDEVLFIAGEKARGLYIIVHGSVRAFRESADGREQVIHVEYEKFAQRTVRRTFGEISVRLVHPVLTTSQCSLRLCTKSGKSDLFSLRPLRISAALCVEKAH